MPYWEPTSSSATNKSLIVCSGVIPNLIKAKAAKTEETRPCWLSSTPRPISFPSFSIRVQGSLSHLDRSPGGTTSRWLIIQSLSLSFFPGMVTIRLGRIFEETLSSGASKRSKLLKPASFKYFSRASHFVNSPSPSDSGAMAGMEVKSLSNPIISFVLDSIKSVIFLKVLICLFYQKRCKNTIGRK